MWSLAKCAAVPVLACVVMLPETVGAQTRSADRCMALPTDPERIECMRDALVAADRLLEMAGIEAAPVPDEAPRTGERGLAALGNERLAGASNRAEQRDEPRYRARIVDAREFLPGQTRFELDNGQVWQQTAADAQRLILPAGEPLEIELWSSWSGGYRMLLPDQRRIVRVERVR